uniref:Uncharacterized protein n=1 Tax=Anguilla anguilla TaxID=7936 RepID=A0A0E9U028_ANGAN
MSEFKTWVTAKMFLLRFLYLSVFVYVLVFCIDPKLYL